MTEQHINQLKYLLEQDRATTNSAELDATILAAAHLQAEQYTKQRPRRPLFQLLNFLRPISLAIVMTFGILLAMGHWLAVEPVAPIAQPNTNRLPFDTNGIEQDATESHQERILPPQFVAAQPQPIDTQYDRDQVLKIYPLPDTRMVIASMQFELEHQRIAATGNIELALNEINLMIKQGQLNDARQRYDTLRDECRYCGLPSSLEVLVLNHQTDATRPGSGTG
ncbi:hypothetical protein [Arenicella xantha]|uniref:Uncharacterized protein n=1 Tax=Arenicella xantha TaxID=644221 RepID=A0A395JHK5_9GAMM|nr:hypothetical protein [Arenicella xantha]RBP48935.1 hypothetical protein DFR28_105275 [Arenicella xantha]